MITRLTFLLLISSALSDSGKLQKIDFRVLNHHIDFSCHERHFKIGENDLEPASIEIRDNDSLVLRNQLCHPLTRHYLSAVYCGDIDGNGLHDMILQSYVIGGMGPINSVFVFDVFFFFEGRRTLYIQTSTFFSIAAESFVDLDGDGRLEFICTQLMIGEDGARSFLRSVFRFTGERFENASLDFGPHVGVFEGQPGDFERSQTPASIAPNEMEVPNVVGDGCTKEIWRP